ncbi:TetR/AcrR family transcriptional regulator [Nonomuraea lactucae]|uniref:TetR/AcrR family transcriptional regulator n=1 Tax=Nonomuraea lactucae TaxID=2249762 RepID=UPI000DE2AE3E|nr:TetR/AcrR family transcriptional regulator [Nonomuraea lactucae]
MPEPASAPVQSGAQIRDRLIDAAVQEFGEQGYDRTRVQDIARRAGLSTGAIYGNFRNKADLLAEAVDRGLNAASRRLGRALNRGTAPADVLEMITADLCDARQRAWAPLLSEALAAARRDPEVGRRVHAALRAAETQLAELVALAQREGALSAEVDAAALARLLLYMSVGADVLATLGVDGPATGPWRSLIRLLFAGLTPGHRTPGRRTPG